MPGLCAAVSSESGAMVGEAASVQAPSTLLRAFSKAAGGKGDAGTAV